MTNLERINPRGEVSQLYPPELRDALVHAAAVGDTESIDRITDELAERGFCRPRHDRDVFAPLSQVRALAFLASARAR